MRFNETEMWTFARTSKCQIEGRLQYKSPGSGFRERYFKLMGNLLFYFRISELGSVDTKSEPVGLLVLENCKVSAINDSNLAFAFQIFYLDDTREKTHIFTTRSQNDVLNWLSHLRIATCQHWRHQLDLMRDQIQLLRDDQRRKAQQQSQAVSCSVRNQNIRSNPFNTDKSGEVPTTNDLIQL